MKRKCYDLADWLILAMHWGLGALVGAGIMFKTASRSAVLSTWLMWGGACMMGGITGLVQNRYWNRDTYRVIPPEEAEHCMASRGLMWLSILTGTGLLVGEFVDRFH